MGAARAGFLVVGWSWMAFDFNWFKPRNADDLVPRLTRIASTWRHHRDSRRPSQESARGSALCHGNGRSPDPRTASAWLRVRDDLSLTTRSLKRALSDQNPTRNPKSDCHSGRGPSSARIAATSNGRPPAFNRMPPPMLLMPVHALRRATSSRGAVLPTRPTRRRRTGMHPPEAVRIRAVARRCPTAGTGPPRC